MIISEYVARFNELLRHATTIPPTQRERVCYFICGLRLQLQIETKCMVSVGRSFLDVVDHARTMGEVRYEAHGGRDKRDRHQGSYRVRQFSNRVQPVQEALSQ